MEKLPRLRARISALGEFHELIRALEALAATQYRAAQEALQVSTRHLGIVRRAGEAMSGGEPAPEPDATSVPASARLTIAVCSEHGFVGAFNERVLDRVEAEVSESEALVVIGRRGGQIAAERSLETVQTLPMAAHANSVPVLAGQLSLATAWVDAIRIVFSRHEPEKPISVDCLTVLRGIGGAGRMTRDLDRPLHHLPTGPLQAGLRDDLIFATIAHCLLESLAGENATRLASMQAADRNVTDKLDQLRQRERTVRQEEITEELLDILTGVSAVSA